MKHLITTTLDNLGGRKREVVSALYRKIFNRGVAQSCDKETAMSQDAKVEFTQWKQPQIEVIFSLSHTTVTFEG